MEPAWHHVSCGIYCSTPYQYRVRVELPPWHSIGVAPIFGRSGAVRISTSIYTHGQGRLRSSVEERSPSKRESRVRSRLGPSASRGTEKGLRFTRAVSENIWHIGGWLEDSFVKMSLPYGGDRLAWQARVLGGLFGHQAIPGALSSRTNPVGAHTGQFSWGIRW